MSMVEEYRNLLGVTDQSSADDIKKAFRKKAKLYHPDRNKNPKASEIFILLTEAYEYLITYNNIDIYAHRIEDVTPKHKTEQERRREYAKQRYDAFKQTDFYKNDVAFLIIFEHLGFVFSIVFLAIPFFTGFLWGFKGGIVGLLWVIATSRLWTKSFKERKNLNVLTLIDAIKRVAKLKQAQIITYTLVHFMLFFCFTIKTVISTYTLLIGMGCFGILGICITKLWIAKTSQRFTISYFIFPFIFNVIFTFNYIFSSNSYTETYKFQHKMFKSIAHPNHQEKSTYIILENHQYKDHLYLKLFYDFDRMKRKKEITYRFEKGLFGFKVLKDYKFNGENF